MRTTLPLFILLLAVGVLTGCRKDVKFTDEGGISLDFSRDTVLFDTLFTGVGSVTKRFVARNPSDNAVRVDVTLEGGSPSPYRLNVDGATGITFDDVEILGGDSIFIFVEVTLDQSNTSNPFILQDHILFNTNGTDQSVLLEAWGQNAHFIKPSPDLAIEGLPPFSYIAGGYDENGVQICETVTWPNDLPYVIYGYGVVDSCCTLIIESGVQVYMHGGAGLWVYRYGQLKAIGSPGQEIVFQGDRLEAFYDEVPGQWDRIWLNEGPAENSNELENVVIKNALVGIQCENVPWRPEEPTSAAKLKLNSVKIRNCSAAGILSRNYSIEATNLLVGDCGQYGVALTGGGEYLFEHFTIANYWDYDIRQTPAFYINNVYRDINNVLQVRDIGNSRFRNGLVHGANESEFQFELSDLQPPTGLLFSNTMLRTTQSTSGSPYFDAATTYRNQNPAFVDASVRDFHIRQNSYAVGRADPATELLGSPFDLDGIPRGDNGGFDLGCYQWVP
ncbi:MAG: hypothetical protein JNM62_11310 [Flavobacteriales bacterium]|nr:hypothetical protein [Flavobacteriales bacterium]